MNSNKEYENFDIGSGLSSIRKDKGLSAEDVYSGICDKSAYGRIEAGITKAPSIILIASFCSRMGVTVDELLSRSRPRELLYYYELKDRIQQALLNGDMSEMEKRYQEIDVEYLEVNMPTIDLQALLHYKAVGEGTFGKLENAIKILLDSLSKTYRESTKYVTYREAAHVNVLLKVSQLDKKYLKIAISMRNKMRSNPKTNKDRGLFLINNAIAYYYFLRNEWQELYDHCITSFEYIKDTDNYLMSITLMGLIGIALWNLGREFNGISWLRQALIVASLMNIEQEYDEIMRNIQNSNISHIHVKDIDNKSIFTIKTISLD
ncbi:helix-turn-helix domain-containing protein [Culicoidibacter larvae]|uniref:Helix-turn-helix transcriptional regulator n=1 Tax=Culicoidibacter larvae TaxID=2579976 RepID=A0A5R8Q7N8_9FIRM|nr:helix-turn-helix transcriptional regulator [Culicoidibacter larvae]TLG70297.1 helix-turn-helix transcriptional regulator [Culicoidibacter larvae]